MKTKQTICKHLATLCCAFTATAVLGQITWVGIPGTQYGTNFGVSTNWATATSTNNQPTSGSICLFDGFIPGNVVAASQDGINHASGGAPIGGGFGASGVTIEIGANQTSPVSIISPVAASTGMGFNTIQVDPGAGQLTIGENTANQLVCTLRPSSGLHAWINNSSHPLVLMPSFQIANGGGSSGHVINFQGTGDFAITNNLRFNNGPTFTESLQWDSTGTTIWAAGGANNKFNNAQGNIIINAGTLVLVSPGLLPFASGSGANTVQNNGTLLKFDDAGQSDTIARAISGGSPIENHSGTNTFGGANTYSGNTILSGGELIAGSAEAADNSSGPLGEGGTISFTGGTLGFGVNNTYDYSPRFSTAPGQAIQIDSAGLSLLFTNNLSSGGGTLTKMGAGTLTLAGTLSYSGLTTVGGGKLVLQGTKTGSGNITVADGNALGVAENGSQITPTALTVGTSASAILEFNNVTNPITEPIAAGTISIPAGSPITININGGAFNTIGESYPLFSWSSGPAPAVTLGIVNGAVGTLSTNANKIVLTISATPYVWTGTNNSSWDFASINWEQSGVPQAFINGALTLFDDSAAGATNVNIVGVVEPASITANNNTFLYTITSSAGNLIGGSASLSKSGNGTLILAGGANTNTGVTTITGGTVSVGSLANGGSASDLGAASSIAANLVLNGGALQYTGSGASSDRLFSVGTGGGTIDSSGSGALSLISNGSLGVIGSGPRTLTLTGTSTATLTANITNGAGGATGLTKSGTGTWILAGTNAYSGQTTIAGGELIVGTGGGSGSLGSGSVNNNSSLDFNVSSTITVGTITGTGAVTNDGPGTIILPGNNNYSGGTTINAGKLQIGNGGATGTLDPNDPVVNNGTFIFNSTGTFGMNGAISGTGNVIVRGSGGTLQAIGGNAYTGWTLIDVGATFQATRGNTGGGNLSSVITNNGTLLLMRQDAGPAVFGYSNNIVGTGRVLKENNNQNAGDVVLAGTNTYTGGTLIAGGGIILGDGINPSAGTVVSNVMFINTTSGNFNPRTLRFNHPEDFTFTNNIISAATDGTDPTARGAIEQMGPGKVTLTGNNSYPGSTTVSAGTLQVGVGGTIGSIGSGNILVSNLPNGVLIFNRSDNLTFTNSVLGDGTLVQSGTGTVTFSGATTNFGGSMTVSNGTLVISGLVDTGTNAVGGNLSVSGGTLKWGGVGAVNTLNVQGNLEISSGTIVVNLNKSLLQSNSFVLMTNYVTLVAGTVTATGGTLKLINAGPLLQAGDKFTIFDQPVSGGASLTVVSPGFTVNNNLAVDGSVTVATVSPPPAITASVSGANLNLSWPANWTGGVHLQSQTNTLAKGIGTNWVTIPGTDAGNTYSAALNKTNATVFYRLITP